MRRITRKFSDLNIFFPKRPMKWVVLIFPTSLFDASGSFHGDKAKEIIL